MILAAQFGAGQPTEGVGWELFAIAAVVVGGTLLTGGVGSVGATLAGVLLLGLIFNILNFENGLGWISLSAYWQSVIRGAFLLLVVAIQARLSMRTEERGLRAGTAFDTDPSERRTTMPRITSIEPGFYRIPLPTVLTDSMHGEMRAFELNTVRIRDADGAEGVGYTFTVGRNGAAIDTVLARELPEIMDGEEADEIERLWHKAWWALHYGGRGGPTVLALSAFDMALWDLKAKRANLPLWKALGGYDPQVPCYAGGIDLELPLDKLLRQTDDNLAKGFRAIKMKVGRARSVRGRGARAGDARASGRRLPADGRRQHEVERRRRDPRRAGPSALRPHLAGGADHPRRSGGPRPHRARGRAADRGGREPAHALGVQALRGRRRRDLSGAGRHQLRRRHRRS